jgi:hypothetical protein
MKLVLRCDCNRMNQRTFFVAEMTRSVGVMRQAQHIDAPNRQVARESIRKRLAPLRAPLGNWNGPVNDWCEQRHAVAQGGTAEAVEREAVRELAFLAMQCHVVQHDGFDEQIH